MAAGLRLPVDLRIKDRQSATRTLKYVALLGSIGIQEGPWHSIELYSAHCEFRLDASQWIVRRLPILQDHHGLVELVTIEVREIFISRARNAHGGNSHTLWEVDGAYLCWPFV